MAADSATTYVNRPKIWQKISAFLEAAMYRCYFLSDGHIRAVEVFDCNTDDDARALAFELLSKRPQYTAVEVWEQARKVYAPPPEKRAS